MDDKTIPQRGVVIITFITNYYSIGQKDYKDYAPTLFTGAAYYIT